VASEGRDLVTQRETLLILTPVKDAARMLDDYFRLLARLDYPKRRISLGFLEGDSRDGTYEALRDRLPGLRRRYRRVGLWKKDFGFRVPSGYPRWSPAFQIPRRTVLAKSRNHLLFRALDDEDWVLWLDVDVCDYPADVVTRMMATGKDILHPHCVKAYGGRTFDLNAWRDQGRLRMEDLRGAGELVRLDAVGGTMLLVRADLHRSGLIFPPFLYGGVSRAARRRNPLMPQRTGELETEGFGILAQDMGFQCWGMPRLEILHRDE